MNLRLRVTLAAIFSTALVIIIAGITLITLISNDAYNDLDDRLKKQTNLVEAAIAVDNTRKFFTVPPAPRRLNPLKTNTSFAPGVVPSIPTIDVGIALRVVSPNGVFLQTEGFPGLRKPKGSSKASKGRLGQIQRSKGRLSKSSAPKEA